MKKIFGWEAMQQVKIIIPFMDNWLELDLWKKLIQFKFITTWSRRKSDDYAWATVGGVEVVPYHSLAVVHPF